jgi:hypothetical protein
MDPLGTSKLSSEPLTSTVPSPPSEISGSADDYFDFWSNIYLKLKEKHLPQIVSGAYNISLQMFTIL